jgi:hypothetical protein
MSATVARSGATSAIVRASAIDQVPELAQVLLPVKAERSEIVLPITVELGEVRPSNLC